jgi:hypothetical protein
MACKVLAGDWGLEAVQRLGRAGPVPDPFGGLQLTPWSIDPPPDLLDFLAVCANGRFYESMAEVWRLSCERRREVKRRVFKYILFGPVRPGNPSWEAFRSRWPSVAIMLEHIKTQDHGTSARACQRLEAKLMIGGVVDALRTKHADIPVQTIPDAVLVTKDVEAFELVRQVQQEQFAIIGLRPTIKGRVG